MKDTKHKALLRPRDAARALGISFPTLKQWIYKGKLKSMRTPGGHHRIPSEETERLLLPLKKEEEFAEQEGLPSLTGRNQLVGRIVEVRYDGLIAQIIIAFGSQRITSVITGDIARQMRLKKGQKVAVLIEASGIAIRRP